VVFLNFVTNVTTLENLYFILTPLKVKKMGVLGKFSISVLKTRYNLTRRSSDFEQVTKYRIAQTPIRKRF